MKTRIVTAVFGGEPYKTLVRVFRRSCRDVMRGVAFTALRTPEPAPDGRPWDCRMNTAKLRLWVEAAHRWPRENLVLADCDMLATGDVRPVFEDRSFDIGYTERSSKLPLNGGILFVRPTQAARRWLRELRRVNDRMRREPEFHAPYRARYHGMNQAAMGCLIEYPLPRVRVKAFPCSRFNAVSLEDWASLDDAVFVHVKSALRRAVLGFPVDAHEARICAPVAERWRAYL